jgi:hypothetical protein
VPNSPRASGIVLWKNLQNQDLSQRGDRQPNNRFQEKPQVLLSAGLVVLINNRRRR